MFIEDTVETESLFLAAVLVSSGARILGVNVEGRLGKIHLALAGINKDVLAAGLSNLVASLSDSEDTQAFEDFSFLIDSSVLGSIEGNYHRLKKLVIKARKNK